MKKVISLAPKIIGRRKISNQKNKPLNSSTKNIKKASPVKQNKSPSPKKKENINSTKALKTID